MLLPRPNAQTALFCLRPDCSTVLNLEPASLWIVWVDLSFGDDAFQVESAGRVKQFLAVLVDRECGAHDPRLCRKYSGETLLAPRQRQPPQIPSVRPHSIVNKPRASGWPPKTAFSLKPAPAAPPSQTHDHHCYCITGHDGVHACHCGLKW